jgi:hypothetical protein
MSGNVLRTPTSPSVIAIKCECPENSMSGAAPEDWYEAEELKARLHEANECPGDVRVRPYDRDGHRVWLCSCCCMSSDVPVEPEGA